MCHNSKLVSALYTPDYAFTGIMLIILSTTVAIQNDIHWLLEYSSYLVRRYWSYSVTAELYCILPAVLDTTEKCGLLCNYSETTVCYI